MKTTNKLSEQAMQKAQIRWDSIAKPLHSLGKLEDSIIKLAGIFETENIDISKKCTIVMCADNGVVAQGVTQTGQEVTSIVAENMTHKNATICHFSAHSNADVLVVDIGIAKDLDNEKIINKKVMYGTNDFTIQPAMSYEQAKQAIQVGIDMVEQCKNQGYKLIATGEMGIGNTCTSSAITACLLNKQPSEVTGKGSGITSSGLQRKINAIETAIQKHSPNENDAIDVLAKVGGLDIAGLTGVFLGGAIHRMPILIDGFISSVAALVAVRICEQCKDFMFATHMSHEPASAMVLKALNLPHMFDLNMCLGEGTGAVLAFPLLDMANTVYSQMSSFDEAKIEAYVPLI